MARLFVAPEAMPRSFSALFLVIALLLGGCSYFRLPILQGNVVKSEDAMAIQPGMSRDEVRNRLGTPLVSDSFQAQRWDYVVFYRDPKGKETRRVLNIHFADDRVTRVDGQAAFSKTPALAPAPADNQRLDNNAPTTSR